MNVLDNINEKIKIWSILFGGSEEPIYDFVNLLIISNTIIKNTLTSSKEKVYKNGYCDEIKKLLSNNGKRSLYRYIYI